MTIYSVNTMLYNRVIERARKGVNMKSYGGKDMIYKVTSAWIMANGCEESHDEYTLGTLAEARKAYEREIAFACESFRNALREHEVQAGESILVELDEWTDGLDFVQTIESESIDEMNLV